MPKLIAIDPWDCRCTECITGEYKSLRDATDDNIADLLAGNLASHLHTGDTLNVSIKYVYTSRNGKMEKLPDGARVTYENWDGIVLMAWEDVDMYRAGLMEV